MSSVPTGPNQEWELDFVSDQLLNERCFKVLTIVDLWDRMSPALEVDGALTGNRVVAVLERLREQSQLPRLLHVDNGPEFTCKALDAWAYEHGVSIEFNRSGKPTDKAHVESFNGRFRDECLDANLLSFIADAADRWRRDGLNIAASGHTAPSDGSLQWSSEICISNTQPRRTLIYQRHSL